VASRDIGSRCCVVAITENRQRRLNRALTLPPERVKPPMPAGILLHSLLCVGCSMSQLRYDIVPHQSGWAIMVTPDLSDAFPSKSVTYEVAVEHARKLQCAGHMVHVYVHHEKVSKAPTLLCIA
jgi:hypothetical protein